MLSNAIFRITKIGTMVSSNVLLIVISVTIVASGQRSEISRCQPAECLPFLPRVSAAPVHKPSLFVIQSFNSKSSRTDLLCLGHGLTDKKIQYQCIQVKDIISFMMMAGLQLG